MTNQTPAEQHGDADTECHGPGDGPDAVRGLGIWELAWPTIIANLLFSAVGIVTIKIVGSLGAEALAASSTGQRVFFALQAVMMAVSAGTTAMVARAWGAGDADEAARVTTASTAMGCAFALALTVPAVLFPRAIASVFGLDESTTRQAGDFIRWLSVFNVTFAVNMVLGAALRAAGDTRTPLWTGAITNLVNMACIYPLVFGTAMLPALGVAGAAVANGIAFGIGAVMLLVMWWRRWVRVAVAGIDSFALPRLRQLVHIGYPAGIEQIAFQFGFVAFLWLVARYGTEAFAAYGVGVSILSVSFVVGFGFSIAGATLVGQHLGARDPQGATRRGWQATWFAVGSMSMLSVIIVAFAEPIARFLVSDDEVVRLTVVFIYCLGVAQPLMAIEFTLGGCLRGAGDTRFPLLTTLTGLIGARVVLSALAMLAGLSVEWVYAALIADYVAKAAMLIWRFRSGRWRQVFDEAEARFGR